MMDLRKTNYLLIIINVVLILVLFFYIGLTSFSKNHLQGRSQSFSSSNQNNEIRDINSRNLEGYKKEHDRFSKAVSSNDLRRCQSLVNEFKTLCEDGIYLNLSVKNQDRSLCENIQSPDLKEVC